MQTQIPLSGKRCQCSECKEFFSSPTAFDKHRAGTHGVDRHCQSPETAGLLIRKVPNGSFWASPGNGRWAVNET